VTDSTINQSICKSGRDSKAIYINKTINKNTKIANKDNKAEAANSRQLEQNDSEKQ
jgi:hypothetical protein